MKNWEVFDKGREVENWACDTDYKTGEGESNGGIEHIMELEGKYYSIITDWTDEVILNPDEEAVPITDEDFLESIKEMDN